MILKSFGCSFIYGTDLPDDGCGNICSSPSKLTWPSLLANDLNYSYTCYARPGSGNLRILEKILNQIEIVDKQLFVIGWTWIDRFDYITVPVKPKNRTEYIGAEVWETIMPIDTDHRATNYYRDLHSQYRDKLTSLTYIKTAIDALKEKNIPFIMTYMDDLLFETKWHTTSAVIYLQEYIKPYMTTFEGKNFLEYSKENGFPISETLHPLEQAHSEAIKVLYKQNTIGRLNILNA